VLGEKFTVTEPAASALVKRDVYTPKVAPSAATLPAVRLIIARCVQVLPALSCTDEIEDTPDVPLLSAAITATNMSPTEAVMAVATNVALLAVLMAFPASVIVNAMLSRLRKS
jgi:hypothetical protein